MNLKTICEENFVCRKFFGENFVCREFYEKSRAKKKASANLNKKITKYKKFGL